MARINPDPYAGGHLFALVNRVTGLLDSEDDATATVRDGVLEIDIPAPAHSKQSRRIEVQGGHVETWAADVAREHGFSDVSHTIEIFGVCGNCSHGN